MRTKVIERESVCVREMWRQWKEKQKVRIEQNYTKTRLVVAQNHIHTHTTSRQHIATHSQL
jgi:hypothetical protein